MLSRMHVVSMLQSYNQVQGSQSSKPKICGDFSMNEERKLFLFTLTKLYLCKQFVQKIKGEENLKRAIFVIET